MCDESSQERRRRLDREEQARRRARSTRIRSGGPDEAPAPLGSPHLVGQEHAADPLARLRMLDEHDLERGRVRELLVETTPLAAVLDHSSHWTPAAVRDAHAPRWLSLTGLVGERRLGDHGPRLRVAPGEHALDGWYDAVELLAVEHYDGHVARLVDDVVRAVRGDRPATLPGPITEQVLQCVAEELPSSAPAGEPKSEPESEPEPEANSSQSPVLGTTQDQGRPVQGTRALLAAAPDSAGDQRYRLVNWQEAFEGSTHQADWLCAPLLERGRAVALFSPAKTGKSLLVLEIAAALATGRPVLGNPARAAIRVLYVDLENTSADFVLRLTAMGYGAADLSNLYYLSFPKLPPLDTAQGGAELVGLALSLGADLVVLDTVSRVLQGDEESSTGIRAMYRHVVMPLKAAGVALLRLDHSGKDVARGQRGSSAKNDDVDAVWSLASGPQNTLTCSARTRGPTTARTSSPWRA